MKGLWKWTAACSTPPGERARLRDARVDGVSRRSRSPEQCPRRGKPAAGGRGWAGAPAPRPAARSPEGVSAAPAEPFAQRGSGGPELRGGRGPRCRSQRLLPVEGERPHRLRDEEARRVLNRVDGSRTAFWRTRAVSGRGGSRGGLG